MRNVTAHWVDPTERKDWSHRVENANSLRGYQHHCAARPGAAGASDGRRGGLERRRQPALKGGPASGSARTSSSWSRGAAARVRRPVPRAAACGRPRGAQGVRDVATLAQHLDRPRGRTRGTAPRQRPHAPRARHGAARCRRAASRTRDELEHLQAEIGQLGALGVDPVRLEAGQEPSVGDLESGAGGVDTGAPAPLLDRRVGLAQAAERRLQVDPDRGRQRQGQLPAPPSRPAPSALRRRESGDDSTASGLEGAASPGHSTSSSSSRRTRRSRCRTRCEQQAALLAGRGQLQSFALPLDVEPAAEMDAGLRRHAATRRPRASRAGRRGRRDGAATACRRAASARRAP